MHLRARLAGEADEALGRAQRGDLVAPDRMRRRVAGDAQRLALVEPRLVLAVEGGAAAGLLQDRQHARVVGDQQAAGRGAHEHLDARRAGQPLELGNVGDIVVRAADPEGEVAMHAALGAARACRRAPPRVVVGGSVLGISNTAVTPPSAAAREPVSRSSLWARPGSRKCTWLSITPGRTCRPVAVDPLARRGARSERRSRRCARRGRRCRARRSPSWLTTVPLARTRSKALRHGLVPCCSGAKAA